MICTIWLLLKIKSNNFLKDLSNKSPKIQWNYGYALNLKKVDGPLSNKEKFFKKLCWNWWNGWLLGQFLLSKLVLLLKKLLDLHLQTKMETKCGTSIWLWFILPKMYSEEFPITKTFLTVDITDLAIITHAYSFEFINQLWVFCIPSPSTMKST